MNYIKYLFSDTKAFKFWIPFYTGVFFYIGIFLVVYFKGEQTIENPYDIIYPLFLLSFSFLSFFIFYTTGYLNLKKQEKFLKEYSKQIVKDSIRKRKVEIFRSRYTVNADRMSGRTTINPIPKFDTFTVFEMKNKIGIIVRTYDLGFLRRELSPILIDTENYENLDSFHNAVNPKISTINWVSNDLEIVFERAPFGVRKFKLIDWKKYYIHTTK